MSEYFDNVLHKKIIVNHKDKNLKKEIRIKDENKEDKINLNIFQNF